MPNIGVNVRVKERKQHKPRQGVVVSTDSAHPGQKHKWLVLFEGDDTAVPRSSQQLLYLGENEGPPPSICISDDTSDTDPFPPPDDQSLFDTCSIAASDSLSDNEATDALEEEEDVLEKEAIIEDDNEDEENPFVPNSAAHESSEVHKELFEKFLADKEKMIEEGFCFEVKCSRPTKIMVGDKVTWVS